MKREEHCRNQTRSQTNTQTMSNTLDPDNGDVPHHISRSTSETVLLDLNENEAKMGKLMREISDKIPSNDGTYMTCMTSVTTFSQKQEFLQDFSPGKMSKFINSISSLDIQRLKKLEVPNSFQDELNPVPTFLKAKEGIVYVTSKGSKSTPQFQSIDRARLTDRSCPTPWIQMMAMFHNKRP